MAPVTWLVERRVTYEDADGLEQHRWDAIAGMAYATEQEAQDAARLLSLQRDQVNTPFRWRKSSGPEQPYHYLYGQLWSDGGQGSPVRLVRYAPDDPNEVDQTYRYHVEVQVKPGEWRIVPDSENLIDYEDAIDAAIVQANQDKHARPYRVSVDGAATLLPVVYAKGNQRQPDLDLFEAILLVETESIPDKLDAELIGAGIMKLIARYCAVYDFNFDEVLDAMKEKV